MTTAAAAPVVVLTRAAGDNAALAAAVRRWGAEVYELPSVLTVPLSPTPAGLATARNLAAVAAVAFASRAGVRGFADLLVAADARLPSAVALWAVGPTTDGAVWHTFGRRAALPARFDAEHLARALCASLPLSARVVLPAAREGRATLGDRLRAAGHTVEHLPVYATLPAPARRPPVTWDARVHYIVCASPSGVAGFFAQAQLPRRVRFVTIGPTTSAAVRARGHPVFAEATRHDAEGLLAALIFALEAP